MKNKLNEHSAMVWKDKGDQLLVAGFRFVGVLSAFTVCLSLYMDLAGIALSFQNFIFLFGGSLIVWGIFHRWFISEWWLRLRSVRPVWPSLMVPSKQVQISLLKQCIGYLKTNSGIFLLLLSIVVSLGQFQFKFNIPQFISIDAAAHFAMGKYAYEHQSLVYVSRELNFHNFDYYPFGASALFTLFAQITDSFLNLLESFQVFAVIFFVFANTYLYIILMKHFRIRTWIGIACAVALIGLGFVFQLMMIGFISQLVGLFLMLVFVDLYTDPSLKRDFRTGTVLASLLAAVFFTYLYWIPLLILFLVFFHWEDMLSFLRRRAMHEQVQRIVFITIVSISSLVLAVPYIVSLYRYEILGYAGNDGGTYKVFLLNFILLAFFIIVKARMIIGEWRNDNKTLNAFVLASIVHFFVLYVLYGQNIVSAYTFAKSMFIIGPVLFVLALSGLEEISRRFDKQMRRSFLVGHGIVIFLMATFPFFYPKALNDRKENSFVPNFFGIEGQMFDIFWHNAGYAFNKHLHRINMSKTKLEFISNITKNHLSDFQNQDGILVIADADTSLWFYALSWIYPRVHVNGTDSIWVPGIVDYTAWKEQRTNPYLVILDTPATEKWLEDNPIDYGEYDVLYKKGDNVLLKAKEGSWYWDGDRTSN